jgi:two-component system chemotaxis sensor kinase CheA
MSPLLEQFLSEARDNLSFIDKNLEKLRFGDSEDMNSLFRAAHTLKGGSGLVGLINIKDITHHAEDLLDALRKNKIAFDEDMIGALYDAFDEIVEIIDATEELGDAIAYDEERVNFICEPIKAFLSSKTDEQSKKANKLETDLQIIFDAQYVMGDLISSFNIQTIAKDLPFEIDVVDNDFINNDNLYLLDIDLDEQCVEFGNDPIYLVTLLGEENIYSVSTYISKDPKYIFANPMEWHTRLCVVAKGNKDSFEDAFYNIADDVKLYPLSIKYIFGTNLDSEPNDVFADFAEELMDLIAQNSFDDLSEKISAITKIISPDSKEYFVLNRAMAVLPSLIFGSSEYVNCVQYIADILGIETKKEPVQKPKAAILNTNQTSKTQEQKEISNEEKAAISILKQQIKVLMHNDSSESIKRIIEHSTNVLSFLEIDFDFDEISDSLSLEKRLQQCISLINGETFVAANVTFNEIKNSLEEIENNENVDAGEPAQIMQEPENKEKIELDVAVELHSETKVEDISKPLETKKTIQIKDTTTTTANAVPKTVKIDQADIDAMMDIVGEILVMKNSLPYIAQNITSANVEQTRRELLNKYEVISRITEQLQDRVMGMRLLPLSYIFSRYPKLVRDISKKLGKKIKFIEEGGDTKLDKTMIEMLADPIVHVIRNSLDHGIEEDESQRVKFGKNPEGFIKISAESKGDKVLIVVEDDGRGIDLEKVISKALEGNLASVEEIEAMSDSQKYMLIFNPGLSTKDEITDLSGRGVGSDAIKKVVEGLGGNIELISQKNVGTKLVMTLPVSVALTKVFHVRMNEQNYALAMDQIVETIKIKTSQIVRSNHKPFVTLRGDLIPVVFETNLIGNTQEEEDIQNIVIVQGKYGLFGLVVNEFVNQLDVVQKPLDGVLTNHPMISGTSLLGNGEILFVLDATKLID